MWWILVIILRKFLVSLAAIIFRKNASFQMAIILMVLFGSFAVQVIYRPYMSPSEYAEILELHATEMGGDGVVSLDDFLEWSRVHNLETLVDDYAAAAWEKERRIERLEAQATSGTPYD